MSIGVATARGEDVVFVSLFKDADQAVYVAKERGRDRVMAFGDIDGRGDDVGLPELRVPDSTLNT